MGQLHLFQKHLVREHQSKWLHLDVNFLTTFNMMTRPWKTGDFSFLNTWLTMVQLLLYISIPDATSSYLPKRLKSLADLLICSFVLRNYWKIKELHHLEIGYDDAHEPTCWQRSYYIYSTICNHQPKLVM